MPNRIIKESICSSDTLFSLTAEEERLFYRLMVNCDDFGRFDARPAVVKNECFRLDEGQIKIESVEQWINRLHQVGLIILYLNNGKKFLQYVTWDKHQQRRATKSKYPSPDDSGSVLIAFDINCLQKFYICNNASSADVECDSKDLQSNDINCNQVNPDPANLDRARLRISNTNTNIEYDQGVIGGEENNGLPAQTIETALVVIPYSEIIDYLNLKAGTKFRSTTESTREMIRARFNDKFTYEDFINVIDTKCTDWLGTDQEKYLRPETLFRPSHFESYLNQKKKVKTKPQGQVILK
jgi:uncharacterized phage protein (TIGR02220 family)